MLDAEVKTTEPSTGETEPNQPKPEKKARKPRQKKVKSTEVLDAMQKMGDAAVDNLVVAAIAPIKGYRQLPPEAVEMINEFKVAEEELLRALDAMRGDAAQIDQRWLAVGRTHLEQAFMAINRSIAQPQRIALPGDDQ